MVGKRHPFLVDLQPHSPSNEKQSKGRGPGAGEHLDSPTSRILNLLISYKKYIQSSKNKRKGTQPTSPLAARSFPAPNTPGGNHCS